MPQNEQAPPSERQRIQRELVEEGEKLPGVATALEVYKALNPFTQVVTYPTVQVRYATGANA